MTNSTVVPPTGQPLQEEPVRRFGRLWREGLHPDLQQFLSQADELSHADVAAIVRIDQCERWRAGERIPAEAYLRDYMSGTADPEVAVDLVYQEFMLREELGEAPSCDEYQRRFPHLAGQIGQQIELHRALGASAEPRREVDAVSTDHSSATQWGHSEAMHTPRAPSGPEAAAGLPNVKGYEILAVLGRGGMGVVYKARQLGLKRLVALKMILARGHASAEQVVRFRAEGEAVARLQHPHIVQVHEVGEADGYPFFSLEFVEGGSLAARLHGTAQPPRAAAQFLKLLAEAVHYAHQHGVIHRDLKPANILLVRRESVSGEWSGKSAAEPTTHDSLLTTHHPKIADFGLAKLTEGSDMTHTGASLGTPSYMAPEQALDAAHTTAISDVYSLGATLYHLLTGRPPFQAASPAETLHQVLHKEPVPPRQLNPSIDRDLETVCLKCLQKEPGKRYASAAALADDVQRYLNGEPIEARPVGRMERTWRWCRRNPAVASLLGGVALSLLLGALAASYFAVQASKEAGIAKANARDARLREAEALVGEAHGTRYSRREGQRFAALAALKKAAEIGRELNQPPPWFERLRNEAIAALALPDLHITRQWPGRPEGTKSVAVSGDFQVYARSDKSNAVSVRRMEDDSEIAKLPGGPASPYLFLSHDGRNLGQLFPPFFARLWQFEAGEAKEPVQVQDVAWMSFMDRPEGRRAVCVHSNGALSVHDLASGRRQDFEAVELTTHCDVSPHPIEPLIAIYSYYHQAVLIRNILTGAVVKREIPPWSGGSRCAWHPSGRYLCICGSDVAQVRVYHFNAATSGLTYWRTIPCGHGDTVLIFNQTGDRFVASGWLSAVSMWDFWTSQKLFETKSSKFSHLTLKSDGDELAFASVPERPDHLGVWSVADAREYRSILPATKSDKIGAFGFELHPGGRLAAASFLDGIRILDLTTGAELAHLSNEGTAAEGRYTGGRFDAAGSLYTDSFLGLFRWPVHRDPINHGKWSIGPPSRLPFHPGNQGPGVSRDGSVIAQSMYAGYGMAPYAGGWILHPDSPTPRWVDPGIGYTSCSVSPDGCWAAFALHPAGTNSAKVFETATGKLVWESPKSAGWCRFSPDGRWLLTGNSPGLAYDVGSWKPGPELGEGWLCDCTADNSLAVLNLDSGVFRLVEMASGRELARLEDPDQYATFARFTPDGTRLVAQAQNGLRVWDLRRIRQELTRLGLDWDAKGYPPEQTDSSPPMPLEVEVVGADLITDERKMAQRDVDALTQQLVKNPRDARAHFQLGDSHHRLYRYEAAYDAYTDALKLGGESPMVLYRRALAAYQLQRWKAVIDDATPYLTKYPPGPTLYRRAQSLRRLKRYPEALADYSESLRHFPDDAASHVGRALCYEALGQADKAAAERVQALELAVKREPDDPSVLNNLAWWSLTGPADQRDVARALQFSRKAIAQDPASALLMNTLGVAQYRNGQYQEALATLEKNLAAGKGAYDAFDLFFLAMCHAKLDDAAKAKDCFDRAVKWVEQKKGLSAQHADELKQFRTEAEGVLGKQ